MLPKNIFLFGFGIASCLGLVYPVLADWHAELSLRSQYINRGYSKSRGHPVVQANLNYQTLFGWYAGTAVSQISFGYSSASQADVEIKPYIGFSLPWDADWRADVSIGGYIFNGKIYALDANYAELNASINYKDNWSGKVSFAPDAYHRQVNLFSYELNYRRDLVDSLQFSAGIGYFQAQKLLGQDYFYWNAGFSWFLTNYLSVDARYVDTQLKEAYYYQVYNRDFYPAPLQDKYLLSINIGF